MRALLTVALLSLLLGACGWHPRGVQELPEGIHELRLQTDPSNPQLHARLQRALEQSGARLVNEATAWALVIGPEQRQLRNVALDREARSAEQEMRLSLDVQLRDPDGRVAFGPRTLSASRIYAYDANSVIAKRDEEKLIHEELRENLIGQLLRQLQRADLQPPA